MRGQRLRQESGKYGFEPALEDFRAWTKVHISAFVAFFMDPVGWRWRLVRRCHPTTTRRR